jgi:hypothetical protein
MGERMIETNNGQRNAVDQKARNGNVQSFSAFISTRGVLATQIRQRMYGRATRRRYLTGK